MAMPMNAELIALLRASPEIDLLHREAAYRQEAMEATGLQVGFFRGYMYSFAFVHTHRIRPHDMVGPTHSHPKPRVPSLASLRALPPLPNDCNTIH